MPRYLIGVDECGTGAWAGPFVVCAAAVPLDWLPPPSLRDSKRYKAPKGSLVAPEREIACSLVLRDPRVLFTILQVTPADIDRFGQGVKHREAMQKAAELLLERLPGSDVIFDGTVCPLPSAQAIPKADDTYPAVMAASVIGKTFRDRKMITYAEQYPLWGFDVHKGYGTAEHQKQIALHGLSQIHRRSIQRFSEHG